MWRAQLGAKEVKTITQADDDDWDTDPDFVVSTWSWIPYVILNTAELHIKENDMAFF